MKKTRQLIKRTVAIVLSALLVGSAAVSLPAVVPETGIIADATELSDFTYEEGSNGEITILSYEGSDSKVTIPSTIDGKKVTSIHRYAFNGNTTMTEVTLPDTMTSVSASAFYGSAVETVNLPSSIQNIDSYAFQNCFKLTSVNIAGNIDTVYDGAFYNCFSLSEFSFDRVSKIKRNAFTNTAITSVTIPYTVTEIGEYAIGYKYEGSSFTQIDGFTVTGEYGTEAQRYAESNGLKFIGTNLFTYTDNNNGTCAITGYTGNEASVIIPSEIHGMTVTRLEDEAFVENKTIESVEIPGTITEFGDYVFYGCTSLERAVFYNGAKTIGYGTFCQCTALKKLYLPNSLETIESAAFSGCKSLKTVNLPENLKTIGMEAFYQCDALESISIPDSVTTIEESAFYGCRHLTGLYLPTGITSIENSTFAQCQELGTVIIPENITAIGEYAFYDCGLTSAFIPKNVTVIGEEAFGANSDLTIYVEAGSVAEAYAKSEGLTYSSDIQFKYSTNEDGTLTITGCPPIYSTLVIPKEINGKTVTAIGNSAFYPKAARRLRPL